MFSATNRLTHAPAQNGDLKRHPTTHPTHGNYQGRRASKAETSCFTSIRNKFDSFFQATKRLANRVIEKIEDFLYSAGTAISESAQAACDYVKNIETPFKRNYFKMNIGGYNIQAGRNRTVEELFTAKK
jgi:hypothetical protein